MLSQESDRGSYGRACAPGCTNLLSGGTGGSYNSPVLTAELYNPDTGTWSTMAAQTAPRVYHSSAVLLARGQVLSAGEDNSDLTVTTPPDGNHAPPGWYMLFILNSSGVPSVASWVRVG